MCGIAGFAGAFDPERLARANGAQAHRGPDADGIWLEREACVGLAHRRLSIIDLSPTGAQPMSVADDAVVLVFNGEIYNFRELRAELEAAGHRLLGRSDTEVLLHMYLAHGDDMLGRLNGIFALALWDKRDGSLLLARDALGVKPLYYAAIARGVAFSSEIKALLHLVPECRELDVAALHQYLTFLWTPGNRTPLRGVSKLGPGEALRIRNGAIVRRWTWYRLPVARGVLADLGEAEAVAGTRAALREAVRRQLVADVPVGAFLSGGLDSSAVVAFARELTPDLRCFTIEVVGRHDPGMTDDLPFARRVARHLDVSLDVVTIEAGQMARDVERMVAQLDEPLADPAPLNVLYISRLARAQGMKVLLSGAGGDDLFTGYRRHAAVAYQHYLDWLPRRVRTGLEGLTSRLDQRHGVARRLTKLFDGAGLAGDARLVNYFAWSQEARLLGLYTADFRRELGGQGAAAPMHEFLATLPASAAPLDRMLALEQRFFLSDHNLTYTDKMSMAEGVEVRVPFLDLDLVEHAARVPLHLKQRGGIGKWVLKKAMEPDLPLDVIHRPKSGFGAPLRQWMRRDLRPLVDSHLSTERLARRGLFDPAAVRQLVRDNESGRADAYTLFALLCIEIWCCTYLDARATD